jgi:4-alpha-glucanotransferase
MPWPLVECAMASVARLAVVPLQDFLGLGSEHRMNIPGTTEGNWGWRFEWDALGEGLARRLRELLARQRRLAGG